MIVPTTAAATLWAVWLVGWVTTARATAKTIVAQSATSRLAYSLFIWAGALLLFRHPRSSLILFRQLLARPIWIGWVGVAIIVLGLGFAAWARFHLGRLWSGTVTLKENHTIIRTGPYGVVRHPIYTGLVLALAGTALTHPTPAALVGMILVLIGFVIKLRQEEELLTVHFAAAYDSYKKDVPALIPYVW